MYINICKQFKNSISIASQCKTTNHQVLKAWTLHCRTVQDPFENSYDEVPNRIRTDNGHSPQSKDNSAFWVHFFRLYHHITALLFITTRPSLRSSFESVSTRIEKKYLLYSLRKNRGNFFRSRWDFAPRRSTGGG